MNPNTGEIKMFDSNEEAKEAAFSVPINMDDLTKQQTKRLAGGEQPVIKLKDTKSKVGKKRLKALKRMKRWTRKRNKTKK